MPSESDAPTAEAAPVDDARDALLEAINAQLGSAVLASHVESGRELLIRVEADAWDTVAEYLHKRQTFRFFNWLSAIDWLPSPFGRSLDSEVDKLLGSTSEEADDASASADDQPEQFDTGLGGGDSRFQVFARLHSLSTNLGITVKTDVDESMSVPTWTHEFPGAEWHEREVFEMFGISFHGHPGLRPLYLPGGFEGNPLRKDYPLVARLIKPWPGIVDVEPMPEENTQ